MRERVSQLDAFGVRRLEIGPIKAVVQALSGNMAFEPASRRIAVNLVAPGPIATDLIGGIVRNNPKADATIAASTAFGRARRPDDLRP
jgi:NAD(P)-dependent dehydrogenase (short-subunit alcohol dehydrogenase family)